MDHGGVLLAVLAQDVTLGALEYPEHQDAYPYFQRIHEESFCPSSVPNTAS